MALKKLKKTPQKVAYLWQLGVVVFSAAPTVQNSPELHFRFINYFIQSSLLWSVAVSERILDRGDKTDRMLGVEPVLQISTQWEAGHLGTYCIAPTKSHHTNREMGWLRITYSIFCSKFTQHIAELNSSLPHIIVIMVSLTCLPTMKKIIKALIVKKWKKNHIGTHSFFLWKISKLHWELPSPMLKTIKNNTAPFAYKANGFVKSHHGMTE